MVVSSVERGLTRRLLPAVPFVKANSSRITFTRRTANPAAQPSHSNFNFTCRSILARVNGQTVVREIQSVPNAWRMRRVERARVGIYLDEIADESDAAVGKTDIDAARMDAARRLLPVRKLDATVARHAEPGER